MMSWNLFDLKRILDFFLMEFLVVKGVFEDISDLLF